MIIQLKIAHWDKIFEAETKNKKTQYKIGEDLVVRIDSHTDLAKIINLLEKPDKDKRNEKVIILRKATKEDLKKMERKEKRKIEFLKRAIEIVKDSSLPMKLVDAHLSLDGGQIVFAFISPKRVDFRELVKKLSQEFHRSIRLHQINPREEMRIFSGIGPCGRRLCCLSFLKILGGVSTDLIEEQQLTHRGIDRLSGPCGRLKCCLSFEIDLYKELTKSFPSIGTKVETKDKSGEVVGWHILEETVDLKIDEDTIIKVPLKELKIKT